jgi:transketolase
MEIDELVDAADRLRGTIVCMARGAGSGHVSSALSQLDILVTLYLGGILRIDWKDPKHAHRDRFILSKGHGAIGLYPILCEMGLISFEELLSYGKEGSKLCPHCSSVVPGIEVSTGSLGHGLPIATGMAEAAHINNSKHLVCCLLGDGELFEGSNWEAAAYAGSRGLSNLMCIVDKNNQGSMGFTDTSDRLVTDLPSTLSLTEKFVSFGFEAYEVDGHSIEEMFVLFKYLRDERTGNCPIVVAAHTIKGKGCQIMENKRFWHGRVP